MDYILFSRRLQYQRIIYSLGLVEEETVFQNDGIVESFFLHNMCIDNKTSALLCVTFQVN